MMSEPCRERMAIGARSLFEVDGRVIRGIVHVLTSSVLLRVLVHLEFLQFRGTISLSKLKGSAFHLT
jgi:hypothetical protein